MVTLSRITSIKMRWRRGFAQEGDTAPHTLPPLAPLFACLRRSFDASAAFGWRPRRLDVSHTTFGNVPAPLHASSEIYPYSSNFKKHKLDFSSLSINITETSISDGDW